MKKIIIPKNILRVFDLSPVITNAVKAIERNIKVQILLLKFFKPWPKIKRMKADIKAPAIGSSLKKLTILVPSGWGTPLIVAAPHPKILVPRKYSIKISIIKILRIMAQVFKSFFSFSK
tara:strand:+ start:542 stop:898 length:357 start_codon:yes stop_codon:yes gene_type:complete